MDKSGDNMKQFNAIPTEIYIDFLPFLNVSDTISFLSASHTQRKWIQNNYNWYLLLRRSTHAPQLPFYKKCINYYNYYSWIWFNQVWLQETYKNESNYRGRCKSLLYSVRKNPNMLSQKNLDYIMWLMKNNPEIVFIVDKLH
jgi:hypothetical protein